jgi:hypothetical protein
VSDQAIGDTPQPKLYQRFAPPTQQKNCRAPTDDIWLWGSSKGTKAIAHYDREQNINMQLSGTKNWTFWHPTQLPDLCLHPFMHPANRQVQGPMPQCTSSAGLHTRTATIHGGDVRTPDFVRRCLSRQPWAPAHPSNHVPALVGVAGRCRWPLPLACLPERCRYQVGVCGHRFVLLAREGGGSVSINMPRLAVWRRRSSMCAAESKLNAYRLRVRVLRIRKTLD